MNPPAIDVQQSRQLGADEAEADSENQAVRTQLADWSTGDTLPHRRITLEEVIPNCATCHANEEENERRD